MLGFAYPGQAYPAGYPFGPIVLTPTWAYGQILHMEGDAVAGPSFASTAVTGASMASASMAGASFSTPSVSAPSMSTPSVSASYFDDPEMI